MCVLRIALMGVTIFLGVTSAVKAQGQDLPPQRLIDRVTDQSTQFWRMVASDDGQVIAVFVALGELAGLPPLSVPVAQLIVIDRRNGTVELASRTPDGGFQNLSFRPGGGAVDFGPLSISRDGRFVSFVSSATNLDPAANTPGAYTYLYDRQTQQVRALTADDAIAPGWRGAYGFIDAEASKLLFLCKTLAGHPVTGDEVAFCEKTLHDNTVRVIRRGLNRRDMEPEFQISRDGSQIVFSARGPILTTGAPNPELHLQLYALHVATGEIELISRSNTGEPGDGPSGGQRYAVSDDGNFIAFATSANNIGPPGRKTVIMQRSTGLVRQVGLNSLGSLGQHLSGDGRRLVYLDYAFVLSNDIVRVYDWETNSNRAVARPLAGPPDFRPCGADFSFPSPPSDYLQRIAISGDGRTLVFNSPASNLVPDDRPGCDLFVQTLGSVPQPATPVPGPSPMWLALLTTLLFFGRTRCLPSHGLSSRRSELCVDEQHRAGLPGLHVRRFAVIGRRTRPVRRAIPLPSDSDLSR